VSLLPLIFYIYPKLYTALWFKPKMERNHNALDTVYPVLYLLPAHLVDSYTSNIHESSLGHLASASCYSVVYVFCTSCRSVRYASSTFPHHLSLLRSHITRQSFPLFVFLLYSASCIGAIAILLAIPCLESAAYSCISEWSGIYFPVAVQCSCGRL
jgi:hypothetical protein